MEFQKLFIYDLPRFAPFARELGIISQYKAAIHCRQPPFERSGDGCMSRDVCESGSDDGAPRD
ncbi:hypothetical protein E2C01_001617 [Portunus trituberculatus]|uniref:Uncharacterized protein n=1 Tax=Portunus trituberculatus TaxID=210409 RepID=A0A5B7CKV7_PORTR|nr:hypothetical protein [Portunus trituberculatus]